MTRRWWLVLLVLARTAAADPKPDTTLDDRFRDDVTKVDPHAADEFAQGNTARAADRWDEALAHYRKAIALAPDVDHPHRRACGMLEQLGKPDEALVECEAALKIAPQSPYDQAAVAGMLLMRTPPEIDRALELARSAAATLPTDASVLATWCDASLATKRDSDLATCAEHLYAIDPKGIAGSYYGAWAAAMKGNFDLARGRLSTAHAAGLPDDVYQRLLAAIDDDDNARKVRSSSSSEMPVSTDFLWTMLYVIAGWLAVMIVLLVAGFVLSRVTLRAVARVKAGDTAGDTAREHRLRKLYRIVLALSGLYFYLSMPILLATVVIAGGGLIYAFLAAGYIPIKLVLLIAIFVFVTVGAILRSLFIRAKPGSLGHRIELGQHPRLAALLEDVAKTVGTRPVDAVYLTPGTDMAVTERAGLWASLRGKRTERSLIMGVGLFDGMTQLQLRSVLAHEHGHFRNDDTAGGGFALQVRRSLIVMIVRLAQSGAATPYNPVWWFLRAYHRVYFSISQGASRLQEVLADRWAIQAYGTDGFVAGYRHVVERSVQFHREVQATIKEVVDAKAALPNLYQYRPELSIKAQDDIASAIEAEMTREPDPFDSHPSPTQRLGLARQLAVARDAQPGDGEPIWQLFAEREALEQEMTREVRERVLENHGIVIRDAAPAPKDSASP